MDPKENTVVTLGASGDRQVKTQEPSSEQTAAFGTPASRPEGLELVERAEAARTASVALRDHLDDERAARRVGERISQVRQRAGFTQRELAESLGVTTRTIQNYESGSSSPHRHLHEIAALTGVASGWILYGEGVQTPLADRLDAVMKSLHKEEEVLAHQLRTMLEQTQRLDAHLGEQRTRRQA